ncbi:nickel/cobalt transporter [Acetonema longum]|uniref:Nickel/cobalt efflux system n=1 Tax=Acetonema longum DSM 6540 TaxID=1009370 RepID=F7NM36_9FIRM|nr:hypothetical protein [Acetonema longum]EGO62891.1 hypothetical protein ALO_15812 [Acetonema longum DSM 6540]
MKMRLALVFLILAFILFLSMTNAFSVSYQIKTATTIETISQQVSNIFHHNTLFSKLTKLQQNLNKEIAIKIKDLKQQKDPLSLFPLLLPSFIYGVVHALGPGHGKSIISSWVAAQQRSLGTILLVSISAAALHALTSALIVGGTYIVLGEFATGTTQQLNVYLQIAAAILVIGIGLALLAPLVSKRRFDLEQISSRRSGKPLFVVLSIGVVPCPVTSVILIFCLTLGLIWQGILLIISFAAGMGVSLGIVAFLVWSLKEKLTLQKSSGLHCMITRIFPITGGIFLVITGSAILYSLL